MEWTVLSRVHLDTRRRWSALMLAAMADKVVPMDVRSMVISWPESSPRGAVKRFCVEHGVSRSWFYDLRRRAGAETTLSALQPRPRSSPDPHPQAIAAHMEELAVRIRKELAEDGWDHGAVTVRHKLQALGLEPPAASTLHRVFVRHGMVTAQPQKRPHAADRRFEASLVDELWQLDAFDWHLADGTPCAVFNLLDDCSRTLISHAASGETSEAALAVARKGISAWQVPLLLLSDNGAALNPSRRGRTGKLTTFLKALGCKPITGRPDHPQTQGKDERVHQTQQRWLRAHDPASTLTELQELLDAFDSHYNDQRPHQGLRMLTPRQARMQRPRAAPPTPPEPTAKTDRATARIRVHKVAANGSLLVARNSIYLERPHYGTHVSVIRTEQTITIFDARGTHIRTVQLEPGKRYYGNGKPRGGRRTKNRPD